MPNDHKDVYNEVEQAAALHERFPDLPDREVLDFLDELTGHESGFTNPESVIAHIWLMAYHNGAQEAVRHAKSAFNIDISITEGD